MPNDQEITGHKMTEEEWKRAFGDKPEFWDASDAKFLTVEADSTGQHWAFLSIGYNWAYLPYAVRPQINGRSISLAIRVCWSDEDRPPLQAGDLRVMDTIDLAKATGLNPDFSKEEDQKVGDPRYYVYAVELPFRPDNVSIVDR